MPTQEKGRDARCIPSLGLLSTASPPLSRLRALWLKSPSLMRAVSASFVALSQSASECSAAHLRSARLGVKPIRVEPLSPHDRARVGHRLCAGFLGLFLLVRGKQRHHVGLQAIGLGLQLEDQFVEAFDGLAGPFIEPFRIV
jgi:hypothetical protein